MYGCSSSTIQKSETVAVIRNGRIIEQGSHSELVAEGRGGSRDNLIKLQGSSNVQQRSLCSNRLSNSDSATSAEVLITSTKF